MAPNQASAIFFLGGENGAAFAFLKEQDGGDWENTVLKSIDSATDLPDSLPADDTAAEVLDTSDIRTAGILLKPSDPSAEYDISVHGWFASESNDADSNPMKGFYRLDDGSWAGQKGSLALGANCHLVDAIVVVVDALSAGKLHMEMFPVPYESA